MMLNPEDIAWRTYPIPPTEVPEHWKRSLGEACPHGNEIFLVRGPFIRNNFSSDFVQGDNHYHSPKFVPIGELWLDESMSEEEWPFVAFHECHEAEDMRKGADYETAHDKAQKLEDQFRRIHRPGE